MLNNLEMEIEPIRGDFDRCKVSLLGRLKKGLKLYDSFVLKIAVAKNIQSGNRHPVYSTRIETAERKYQADCSTAP